MKKQSLKNTTRGGQVILHNLRMISQVFQKVVLWTLPLGLLFVVTWFFLTSAVEDRSIGRQWLSAEFHCFFNGRRFPQFFILSDGRRVPTTAGQIVQTPFVRETVMSLEEVAHRSLWVGGITWCLAIIGILIWLKRRGEAYTANQPIKGDQFKEASWVKKVLEKRRHASDLIFGVEQLPLPQYAELQHLLVHGTTGTGKSTVIKDLLDHIRRRGERAIVYDKSCNLVSQFYQSDNDHLLNPLDQRGADWSIWAECRDKADFDNLAAALIPMAASAQDPFWVNAARTIFAAAAFRLRQTNKPQILPLLRYLLTADVGQLQSLLRGTEAESLMSEKAEKTAISIKSVLATYLKSLCYIRDENQPFSIRQWIRQDQTSEWLFISSLGDRHESLKPLITAWLDIAINALLSLSENPQRRIWMILDELGSLQQLPYLTSALAEARKFGGCFVIGVQSIAQLAKTYGFEGGREISSLLNTRFLFRAPDPEIAQWSARNLGETTLEEVREGISYGANTIRDGVSIQRLEVQKPVVPASEILKLENLTCYVRLPGDLPITRLRLQPKTRQQIQPPFLVREFDPDPLRKEVETVMNGSSNTQDHASVSSEKIQSSHQQTFEKIQSSHQQTLMNEKNSKTIIKNPDVKKSIESLSEKSKQNSGAEDEQVCD